ncbi:MAG: ATP-binding protein [Treponema sp.]|nr:ATP-binding protein [Treponema sp.]MCL2272504.1 ATP-binding protein [Treponema sp.]
MTVFKKSFLTLGLIALGFASVLVISSLVFMNSLYYQLNTDGLKNTARVLLSAIGEERIAGIFAEKESAADLPDMGDYRLTLVAVSGNVIWDSHITDRIVNHIDREEIIAALEGKQAGGRRDSVSTGIKRIYYALPVFGNSGEVIGVFRLSLSIPDFSARISPIIPPFVIFSSLMTLLAFFSIYAYSRSFASSIGRIVSITRTGTSLLPGENLHVTPEFLSLEKALRAMISELNSRIENAKAESRRLEAILNGMSEAVFAMDTEFNLEIVNPKARELFNLENREIKTMTLLEATRSTELVNTARIAANMGAPFETELTFHTGGERQFQIYASVLEGENGGVVLVLLDITKIIKLERIRKDFVANVSHELRTPIQLVKGFSETLLDAVNDGDKKSIIHFIEIIQKNAANMENLTNDLLALADLENNSSSGRELEEFDVAFIINEAVSSVESQAEKKQIEIIIDCPDNLKAKFYGSFMVQALINLIDNGIKYSSPKSKIRINAFVDNSELTIEVRDKGIGISAEHQKRIFERFYRVDRSRSKEEGGTGLGLAIVRHIALLHKGKAEAESRAGEGSVFRIRIPCGS